jgi:hypothetical protein
VDGPYLVNSSIHRFSLRFTTATVPFPLPLTLLRCAGAPEGARSRHRAFALPASTPFTSESLAPHAIFHPPPLVAESHLMGRFSTRLEPQEAVICLNRPRRR